jgi:hypothetical protein
LDAGVATAELCGSEAIIAPMSNESAFLFGAYESRGFEKVGYLIRRRG